MSVESMVHRPNRERQYDFERRLRRTVGKGIVALLFHVLSEHTPQEILDADLYFIDRIGLREHLSPTRTNGIVAMLKQIKMYALAFSNR